MRRSSIVFLLPVLCLFLQGCVPAAFIAGAVTGTIIYDHRPAKVIIQDRDMTFRIQGKLNSDLELRNKTHISTTTFNHIVLLVGQAPDAQLRSRAEKIAKSIPKIRILYNEITISKPISNMAKANDTCPP